MHLSRLSNAQQGSYDPEISGLTQDSRLVRRGFLFAALPGSKADGRAYIKDAVDKGAIAILAPVGTKIPYGVALIESANPLRDFSLMAAKFYDRQPKTIAAVTGTNGKTSTVCFIQQLWQSIGFTSASLGTLGIRGTGIEREGSLTTPDPATLYSTLADLAEKGISHLAMEASSHGLHQFRLDGVKISAAGFTNLTRDHLDYHGDMKAYLAAKTRLFTDIVSPHGTAVLNADAPEYADLKAQCANRGIRVAGYGHKAREIKLMKLETQPHGLRMDFEFLGKRHDVLLPVVGMYQAMNVLCALGIAAATEPEKTDALIAALPSLKAPPGRLQSIPSHPEGASIYVDYAHTPDALENVLKSLRAHTMGRLFCIIGCGGDRDPGKRLIMGKIAAELADVAVITDDNPRTEDPAEIRAAMMANAKNAREVGGRRDAIFQTIRELREGDVLVIAGKGHERGQIVGTTVEPFDDSEEAAKAIQSMKETP